MSILIKTLICGGEVSLAVLDTTALVQEAIARHKLSPVCAAALGRTLTAAAYLCSWLKGADDGLSVTVAGDGPGGKICVSGDSALQMRGFIEHTDVELPLRADGKLAVGACVGRHGTLTVIREEAGALPFVGTSELVSGEIGEDFSAYFYTSEQRPTAIAVGVKVTAEGECLGAGGVFLQPLPGASEESVSFAEAAIARYGDISSQIAARGAEHIVGEDFSAAAMERRRIFYRCHCSREKIAGILLSMGRDELSRILEEEGKVSVHCHYCNTDHDFYAEDIARLFGETEKEHGKTEHHPKT